MVFFHRKVANLFITIYDVLLPVNTYPTSQFFFFATVDELC